jgi:hypothetical protein
METLLQYIERILRVEDHPFGRVQAVLFVVVIMLELTLTVMLFT